MKYCPKCDQPHNKPGTFCSRVCANSRGKMTEADKAARSVWAKANPKGAVALGMRRESLEPPKICSQCNCEFKSPPSGAKKFCSTNCARASGTLGGLRARSGRGKSGTYRGYNLDSTYELAYLIWCLDHEVEIQRNQNFWQYINPETGRECKYFPDFRVNGTLVEIKGYRSSIVDAKIQAVTEPIQVLYENDLEEVFNYVTQKTGLKIKDLYKLYD